MLPRGCCHAILSIPLQAKRMVTNVTVPGAIRSGTGTVLLRGRDNCLSGAESRGGATDVSLLWAIRSGDESAMAALYDRYSSIVYAVGLRPLVHTGPTQDSFTEA